MLTLAGTGTSENSTSAAYTVFFVLVPCRVPLVNHALYASFGISATRCPTEVLYSLRASYHAPDPVESYMTDLQMGAVISSSSGLLSLALNASKSKTHGTTFSGFPRSRALLSRTIPYFTFPWYSAS